MTGADRLAGQATITSGLHLERSKVLWSFEHYLDVERRSALPRKDGRRAIVNLTNIVTV